MTSDTLDRPLIYYIHRKFVLADEETPAIEAVKQMYLKASDTIIVTRKGMATGIVTNTDILEKLVMMTNVSTILIKSIMSSPIMTLSSNSTVKCALGIMKSNNIKHIPIMDHPVTKARSTERDHPEDPAQIVGIVTLRSITNELRNSLITRYPSIGSSVRRHYSNSIKVHYWPVIGNLGFVLQFAGILFIVPALVGTFLQDDIESTVGIYLTSLLMLATGFILNAYGIKGPLGLKQGANLVLSSFILLGVFCSIPYMYGDFVSPLFGNGANTGQHGLLFLNSFFESVSGITTTGLTTITDLSNFSTTFSFYRSYTQLVGGLSFIYLIMLIFYPEQKLISMRSIIGWGSILRPKALTLTVVVIFSSYIIILSSITYFLGGIDTIDAISITFTTITGSGFEPVTGYISTEYPIRLIVLLTGMIISALPFAFHYSIFSRRYRSKETAEVILVYSLFLVASILLFHILESSHGKSDSFLASAFSVISASTTTGLTLQDSAGSHSVPAKMFFMVLMMVGGLAFSTAGGIKIDRIVLIFRRLFRLRININHIVTGITSIRYHYQYMDYGQLRHLIDDIDGRKTIRSSPTISSGKEVKEAIHIIILFILLAFIGGLILSHNTGYSLQDSVFESISALTTTGLSSGITSADMDSGSKVLLIFNMIAGRFEIITLFYIFIGMLKGKRK